MGGGQISRRKALRTLEWPPTCEMQTEEFDSNDEADGADALVEVVRVGPVQHRERVEHGADDEEHERAGRHDDPSPASIRGLLVLHSRLRGGPSLRVVATVAVVPLSEGGTHLTLARGSQEGNVILPISSRLLTHPSLSSRQHHSLKHRFKHS